MLPMAVFAMTLAPPCRTKFARSVSVTWAKKSLNEGLLSDCNVSFLKAMRRGTGCPVEVPAMIDCSNGRLSWAVSVPRKLLGEAG